VTDRLPQAWGTILFVVALFGVVVYLYARRPGPATGALLVLGSGLLSSDLTLEIGVSALDAAGPTPLAAAGGVRHPVVLVTAWSLVALSGVGFTQRVGRVIAGETFISTATLGVGLVLAAARYRTATDPISRQQLKWLAGGACISGTLAVSVWFLPGLLLGESLLPAGWLGFSGLPVLAGLTVAVLRYRLFDVDRIISRTLANGLLTVLLGGGYAVVVLGLGQLLGRHSSLAVAAAFQPARRRMQALVDRRFNRRHNDTTPAGRWPAHRPRSRGSWTA
jgi:hypothetical protein